MSSCQYKYRYIILLRHGEAEKNLEDRHGGIGTVLTNKGRGQAVAFCQWLASSGIRIDSAWYSEQPQVKETVKIINEAHPIDFSSHMFLKQLSLGKLAGLSRAEAARLYPVEAKQMEDWRQGKLEVQDLKLPGGDDPIEFYNTGIAFYNNVLCKTSGSKLIVTSRSVLILMASILLERRPVSGGGYVEIPMNPCDRFVFKKVGDKWEFVKDLSTVALIR